MPTRTWNDVLEEWKANETSDCVLALSSQRELRLVAYGFSLTKPPWPPDEPPPEGDAGELWDIAWQHVALDPERIELVSGVDLRQINRCLQALIVMRAIYPDGSLNRNVRALINALTKQQLSGVLGQ